jgi:signal transduction histidine kinase
MRAPLTSMLGLIQLLKNSTTVSEIQSITDLQLKCIYKLDDNIQQIIHLSRNTNTELKIEAISLNQLCQTIFEDIKDNTHSITFKTSIDEKVAFHNDYYRISTVLNNLISNAVKYIRPSADEHVIEIKGQVTNTEVNFTIYDNGIGINASNLPNIFKMFYRATDQSKGTGLGLYIVQEIIKKLDGTIEVQSKENEYTQFEVMIPNQISE